MKVKTYKILTHIPIVGSITKSIVDPIFCSWGLVDGVYEETFIKIQEYHEKHPDVQITKQLIDKLITK
jgi:hypothetical protein